MKNSLLSQTRTWFATLVILLILGGVLRLIDVTDPPLDFQPSRQLRNSLVARDIYYSLLPTATSEQHVLTQKFADSVGQYEPPIIESIVAVSYFIAGGETIVVARLWETFFWLAAGIALFDLMRRAASPWAALIGLTYYLVLPFSVQSSRSFQPDPLMTSAFVIGIYFLYRWSEETGMPSDSKLPKSAKQAWKWAILAAIFLGFATLVKIVIAFFVGGAAVALVLFTLGRNFWKSKQVWTMAGIMIVPALCYYVLLNNGRSTEYFFAWTITLLKLITSTDFYTKWLAFIGSLFGLTIIFLSIAGALIAVPRMRWLLISLWVGYVLYGLTLPFQMYTHSYYHIQLIPIVVLGLAVVLNPLVGSVAGMGGVRSASFVALIVALIGYQAWIARSVLMAESFRHEPAFWENVGEQIPTDGETIALTQDYGFRVMLWGWKHVELWPLVTDLSTIKNGGKDYSEQFIELTSGKKYFLVTAFGQLDKQPGLKKILDTYPVIAEGDGYVLYDLR
ncbi:MAG: glycosyltransferase family 39 protein [Anaerolineales bacterium]|nr:glycosyltransferase family 39 protein [Anaerolineales bacterium]